MNKIINEKKVEINERLQSCCTYNSANGGLRNLQNLHQRFTVGDQVLQDAAGQQDLLCRALQLEAHGGCRV